jgi:uncharacterized membrane protein
LNNVQAVTTSLQQHLAQPSHRVWAMGFAAASMGAMLYVGLYQSRAVRHLWCPVFAKGCEAVADAAFAKPFGIPDGYIAAVLYAVILVLLMVPATKLWIWVPLLVLASAATLANFLGVRDMVNLSRSCNIYTVACTAPSAACP